MNYLVLPFLLAICCFFHFASLLKKEEPHKSQKPNIVFILVDDLGWKDLGCYGNSYYQTPNIDMLCSKGMKFTNAYAASPVCSPTRASLMTGKYPARLQLTNYLVGDLIDSASPVLPAKFTDHLPLEETTIAEELKNRGYATGMVGKWHLGEEEKWQPSNQGFDFQLGGRGSARKYFYPEWANDIRTEKISGKPNQYITDRITDGAVDFINSNRNKSFFLYLSHYAVHIPLQAKADKIAKYRKKPNPNPQHFSPVYAAMIESLDESVGRVVKQLEENKILDKTIIILMSDNGGLAMNEGGTQPTSNAPLREGKGFTFEGGTRSPLIVVWPDNVRPGSTNTSVVSSVDIFPTLLEMAQGTAELNHKTDGISMVGTLKNGGHATRGPIFWHYPHFSNQGGRPSGAVRLGDFKLIKFYETGRLSLYNLDNDVGELNNLAALLPDKTKEMDLLLTNWLKEVNASMPTPNPYQKK